MHVDVSSFLNSATGPDSGDCDFDNSHTHVVWARLQVRARHGNSKWRSLKVGYIVDGIAQLNLGDFMSMECFNSLSINV